MRPSAQVQSRVGPGQSLLRVMQRTVSGHPKTYPNLNPSAAIPVKREEVFKLQDFFGNYRLQRGSEHGAYVPYSKYIFVRTTRGETLLHPYFRHPALAEGRPVRYAGEASFNNGQLEWWSNGSGNYRPDYEHAEQAELPMERFYTFEQILKGAHKQPGVTSRTSAVPGSSAASIPTQGVETETANANGNGPV